MHTFIIADNQDITRAGLRHLIGSAFANSAIIEVGNKKELTAQLLENGEVIVILDYTNTDFNSTDEILNLSRRFGDAKWILFSYELSEPTIKELSLYDCFSMILKENNSSEIISSIQYATRGERYLCHQISNMLIKGAQKQDTIQQLTQTESEILKLIAHGKTVKEIAAMRNSSFHTIVTHKKNIFRKLEVNTVYEATKYALKAGLVEIVEYYI
ncbi:MAG: response regulator transcription factor [Bacteroidales bacterium]|nr:response regulator transcription factor [Bacteroidales bacterium]